ncbi:MAG: hypothetical protein R2912_05000 [Eubacteriales bacterium]
MTELEKPRRLRKVRPRHRGNGDGDRLGIIDGTGRYISANEILVLLYTYLHEVKGWKGACCAESLYHAPVGSRCRIVRGNVLEVPAGFKHISSRSTR